MHLGQFGSFWLTNTPSAYSETPRTRRCPLGSSKFRLFSRRSVTVVSEADESFAADFAVSFLEPSDKPGSLGRLGDFELQEVIGRSAMGIVLKGIQPELNRLVAVKVMAPHLATSGRRESDSLARRRQPPPSFIRTSCRFTR